MVVLSVAADEEQCYLLLLLFKAFRYKKLHIFEKLDWVGQSWQTRRYAQVGEMDVQWLIWTDIHGDVNMTA